MSSAPIRAMNPSPDTPAVKMGTGQEGQAAGHLLLADSGDLLKAGADPVCQQFVKRHALVVKPGHASQSTHGHEGAPGCRAVAALSAAGRSHRPVITLNLTRALVTEGNHSPHRERARNRRSASPVTRWRSSIGARITGRSARPDKLSGPCRKSSERGCKAGRILKLSRHPWRSGITFPCAATPARQRVEGVWPR
jgi:hypothetical protein